MEIWYIYLTKEGFIEAARDGSVSASDKKELLLIIYIPKGKACLLLKVMDSIRDSISCYL